MKKSSLVPELRFPEFVDDAEWVENTIGDIVNSESSSIALNKLKLKEDGYPVYGADSIVGYIESFQQKEKYISIVKDGSGVGRLNLCEAKSSILGTLTCLKSKDIKLFNLEWIYFIMNTVDFTSYKKGSGIPHIYYSDFKFESIGVPSPREQKKIAACLSSIDELIESHNQKLEALKVHKKGLMQNLFPQEGEKVPKFRFPEFEYEGVWVKSSLNKISSSIFDGTHQTPKYTNEGIPFFSVENIVSGSKNKFISREDYLFETRNNKPEFGDILVTRIGSIGIPKVVNWEYEFSVYVTLAVVKKSDMFNSYFLSSYIQSSRFQAEIYRRSLLNAAPQKINMNEFRECEVMLPTNICEQNKIASCFRTLDNLIVAQTDRIEQLKTHKKGLMQGLFPNSEN